MNNNVIIELEKRISNRYELIEDGLKDLIPNITEILSILECVRYLEFVKKKIVQDKESNINQYII